MQEIITPLFLLCSYYKHHTFHQNIKLQKGLDSIWVIFTNMCPRLAAWKKVVEGGRRGAVVVKAVGEWWIEGKKRRW